MYTASADNPGSNIYAINKYDLINEKNSLSTPAFFNKVLQNISKGPVVWIYINIYLGKFQYRKTRIWETAINVFLWG